MNNRQKTWTLIAAAISFVAGFILWLNDSAAGVFLIFMGIIYIGTLTRPGQKWAESNPSLSRWGLIGVTLLVILLVIVVAFIL